MAIHVPHVGISVSCQSAGSWPFHSTGIYCFLRFGLRAPALCKAADTSWVHVHVHVHAHEEKWHCDLFGMCRIVIRKEVGCVVSQTNASLTFVVVYKRKLIVKFVLEEQNHLLGFIHMYIYMFMYIHVTEFVLVVMTIATTCTCMRIYPMHVTLLNVFMNMCTGMSEEKWQPENVQLYATCQVYAVICPCYIWVHVRSHLHPLQLPGIISVFQEGCVYFSLCWQSLLPLAPLNYTAWRVR